VIEWKRNVLSAKKYSRLSTARKNTVATNVPRKLIENKGHESQGESAERGIRAF